MRCLHFEIQLEMCAQVGHGLGKFVCKERADLGRNVVMGILHGGLDSIRGVLEVAQQVSFFLIE